MREELQLLEWGLATIIKFMLFIGMVFGIVVGFAYILSSNIATLIVAIILLLIAFGFFYIAYKQNKK